MNISIYIVSKKETKEITNNEIVLLPRINEIIQYNGIQYYINNIIHHYHESFKPYIELIVTEIE